MLHYAIDHGVNYLGTAYPYHGGNREQVVGKALQGGYRERVKLATKPPAWAVESEDDFDKYLNEQLEELQTEHIDVYQLHGMRPPRWETIRKQNVLRSADRAIADGGALGFSFHDTFEVFRKVVDGCDRWAMCQIQNYPQQLTNAPLSATARRTGPQSASHPLPIASQTHPAS